MYTLSKYISNLLNLYYISKLTYISNILNILTICAFGVNKRHLGIFPNLSTFFQTRQLRNAFPVESANKIDTYVQGDSRPLKA